MEEMSAFLLNHSDTEPNNTLRQSGQNDSSGQDSAKILRKQLITWSIFAIGFLPNVVVIFTILRSKILKKPTYICLASLAISDAIFISVSTILSSRLHVIYEFHQHITIGISFVQEIGRIGSSYHLVLISAVRCYSIGYPLESLSKLTNRRTRYLCLGIHLFSLVLGVLNRVFLLYLRGDGGNGVAFELDTILVYFAIPIALLILFHSVKFKWFADMRKEFNREHSGQCRLLVMVVMVIVMFVILQMPFAIRSIFITRFIQERGYYPVGEHLTPIMGEIAAYCTMLNSALNPISYAIMSPQIRGSCLIACFDRKVGKNRSVSRSASRQTNVQVISN